MENNIQHEKNPTLCPACGELLAEGQAFCSAACRDEHECFAMRKADAIADNPARHWHYCRRA
jgi:hypothetical protein